MTGSSDQMTGSPTVSVVCNTLDRADALGDMLRSLRYQTFRNFEVVVVAGPCTDHTVEVARSFGEAIKFVRCLERNLSMSRNLGIAAAAGDVVAFIDDDGVPEPTWLAELVGGYDSDEVAGVGGVVRDHTGYEFQCRFNRADRIGSANDQAVVPLDDLSFPGSWEIPYLVGTNSSFRRDLLISVGGFDEEIEFYLDETDVCIRLVDAGYLLRQLDGAEVHHKFLPSGVRNAERVTIDLFAVVKNRIYFSFLHAWPEAPMSRIMASHAEWVAALTADLEHQRSIGRITSDDLEFALGRIEEGWRTGMTAGLAGRRVMFDQGVVPSEPFRPFPTIDPPPRRLRVCMVSQFLPPADTGGTGRFILDTARELAARGHDIRVLTAGQHHDTVDLEDGVWVHRLVNDRPQPPSAIHDDIPDRIWRNAGAVADEVERLNELRPVDAVLGVMWDVETIGVIERTEIPVVTTLVTTMGITLRTRPEWRDDPEFMRSLATPLVELERWLILRSHRLHAISEAILDEASAAVRQPVEPESVVIAPLGVPDHLGPPCAEDLATDPTVLFVGRFERRKGIDLVLGAIPTILEQQPNARVVLIGRNDLPGEHGPPYLDRFLAQHGAEPWMDRLDVRGIVSDDELWAAYRSCHLVLAPSRFESFGLIYVEAMMAGKPVIALDAGAAPEVIGDWSTGRLIIDDADAVAAAALSLLADPQLAQSLGDAGRRAFVDRFSARAMSDSIEQILLGVVEDRR